MANTSEHRRLLAVLVADIVGYSGLMARFESETFQRVKELQSTLMMPSVARNRGEIVKYTGDGFIATFPSALDAVRAAVEVQSGAKAASATAEEERRILFRIGINVGDVIVVPGDIYGDSVNVAARLQGLAKPGGICVSRAVRDTVKGKFEIDFTDLGDMDVKNIPDPVGTYELRYQAIAWTMERKGADKITMPFLRKAGLRLLAGSAGAVVLAAVSAWFWIQSGVRPPTAPVVVSTPSSPLVASVTPPPSQPAMVTAQLQPSAPAAVAQPAFEQLLDERLARMVPGLVQTNRAEIVSAFVRLPTNRSLAVAPSLNGSWRIGSYDTPARAEERALEACQIRHGQPCAPVAVNDALSPIASPPWPFRNMPRVTYAGLFDPAQLPTTTFMRTRSDVAGYRTAVGPKAAAIHAAGYLHIVTGAPNQTAAEEQALGACTADPTHNGRDLPCFLYAVGDQVVLPRRATTPVTAVVSIPLPAPTPQPVTESSLIASAQPPNLKQQIMGRIAARAPALDEAQRAERVDAYLVEKTNRALAVAPRRSATWRVGGHQTAAEAEDRALEGCMINYGEPCVLVALNEVALQSNVRVAQRVSYSGLFEPNQLPTPLGVRHRADTLAYRSAPGPKAVAIHPWGFLHIVTGAASQREAEEKALAECTANPIHRARDLPCYLYAVGDEVVLPRRASRPITP
jgi:class 3 adenylate cyclase